MGFPEQHATDGRAYGSPASKQDEWQSGVYLHTTSDGARVWVHKTLRDGRRVQIQLGTFPGMSLRQAHVLARTATSADVSNILSKRRKERECDLRARLDALVGRESNQRKAARLTEPATGETSAGSVQQKGPGHSVLGWIGAALRSARAVKAPESAGRPVVPTPENPSGPAREASKGLAATRDTADQTHRTDAAPQVTQPPETDKASRTTDTITHANIRGADYFQ